MSCMGRETCRHPSMAIRLDGFAVALPVGLDEVEEMGAGVLGCDAFPLYPIEILAGEIGHVPFPGQLAGLAARHLVKAAALQYGLNIAKMSPGASCQDFAVKAHFRRS